MPTATKTRPTIRFRSNVARGIEDGPQGVDRNNDVVRGFSVITKGPVATHGMEADDATLDQVVKLGNRTKLGVKSRFGHPTMSAESLGTFLGRAKGFRRDGDVVRADLHLDETAHSTPSGDLAGYVLDLAESDPGAFGSSIVFEGETVEQMDEDGKPDPDLPPLVRVKKLHASDIVDDPAANNGFFATQFFTADCELSAKASEFLDRFLSTPESVDRVISFLGRYSTHGQTPFLKEDEMSDKKRTELDLPADPKEPEGKPETFSAEDLNAAVKGAVADALRDERSRSVAIRESAFSGQEALVAKAIEEGLSVPDAQALFIRDRKEKDSARLEALKKDPAPDLGPNEDSPAAKSFESLDYDEDALKAQWEKDPGLRKEFDGNEKAFLAFHKARSRGHIRQTVRFNDEN